MAPPPKPPAQNTGGNHKERGSVGRTYLLAYNVLSLLLRSAFLLQTLNIWAASGYPSVYRTLHYPARVIEGLSVLDVLHAAVGLLGPRVSPATAALQVSGRNTILLAIVRNYPSVMEEVWHLALAYAIMLVVWNIADVVRYGYYCVGGLGLEEAAAGRMFKWLRYNAFIILYPVGVLCEMAIAYNVIDPARERNAAYPYLLWFGLLLYIPSFYVLYGHLLSQRRRQYAKAKRV